MCLIILTPNFSSAQHVTNNNESCEIAKLILLSFFFRWVQKQWGCIYSWSENDLFIFLIWRKFWLLIIKNENILGFGWKFSVFQKLKMFEGSRPFLGFFVQMKTPIFCYKIVRKFPVITSSVPCRRLQKE